MNKQILSLIIMTALTASVCVSAQVPYTNSFTMENAIPNEAGWSYWFIPTGGVADSMNVKMTCVNAGESLHGPHIHNHDELFVMYEGEAIVHLNGKEHLFKPGDGLYCPAGSAHSIRKAHPDQRISYLMVNRVTKEGIKEPFPFYKKDYDIDDCHIPFKKNKSFWFVKKEQTLGGTNSRSVFLKENKTIEYPSDGRQLIIIVTEGSADITVDGKPVHLSGLSVCYVPKGSSCTVKAKSGPLRYLEARNN